MNPQASKFSWIRLVDDNKPKVDEVFERYSALATELAEAGARDFGPLLASFAFELGAAL